MTSATGNRASSLAADGRLPRKSSSAPTVARIHGKILGERGFPKASKVTTGSTAKGNQGLVSGPSGPSRGRTQVSSAEPSSQSTAEFPSATAQTSTKYPDAGRG